MRSITGRSLAPFQYLTKIEDWKFLVAGSHYWGGRAILINFWPPVSTWLWILVHVHISFWWLKHFDETHISRSCQFQDGFVRQASLLNSDHDQNRMLLKSSYIQLFLRQYTNVVFLLTDSHIWLHSQTVFNLIPRLIICSPSPRMYYSHTYNYTTEHF